MLRLIIWQRNMFLISLFLGVVLAAAYDVVRCFRRIIPHNNLFIAIEDFFFWVASSIVVTYHVYVYNSGILRWYIFLGIAIGTVVYLCTFSKVLMLFVDHILCFLKKIAKKIKIVLKNVLKEFKM